MRNENKYLDFSASVSIAMLTVISAGIPIVNIAVQCYMILLNIFNNKSLNKILCSTEKHKML